MLKLSNLVLIVLTTAKTATSYEFIGGPDYHKIGECIVETSKPSVEKMECLDLPKSAQDCFLENKRVPGDDPMLLGIKCIPGLPMTLVNPIKDSILLSQKLFKLYDDMNAIWNNMADLNMTNSLRRYDVETAIKQMEESGGSASELGRELKIPLEFIEKCIEIMTTIKEFEKPADPKIFQTQQNLERDERIAFDKLLAFSSLHHYLRM